MHEDLTLSRNGPLDRVLRRIHLASPLSRGLALAAATWLSLLIISILQNLPAAGYTAGSYLTDISVYARFLISLPMLLLAEQIVDRRVSAIAKYFMSSGLVAPEESSRYDDAIEKTTRLRNSIPAIMLLILGAYFLSLFVPDSRIMTRLFPWRAVSGWPMLVPTPAGWYYYLFSLPLYNFFLLLWLWRLVIWSIFLRNMSRLNLRLIATHPDLTGGLGILNIGQISFWPVILAGGTVMSAAVGQRIVFGPGNLSNYYSPLIAYIIIAPLIFILPLVMFSPILLKTRIDGLFRYGALSNEYFQRFQTKWTEERHHNEELLGTPDIQSFADLGGGTESIRKMRLIPIDKNSILALVVAAALPMVPLIFTQFHAAEILARLFKILF